MGGKTSVSLIYAEKMPFFALDIAAYRLRLSIPASGFFVGSLPSVSNYAYYFFNSLCFLSENRTERYRQYAPTISKNRANSR